MVHTVLSQLKQNQNKKKLWNHNFSAGIWFLLLNNNNQLLHNQKTKEH